MLILQRWRTIVLLSKFPKIQVGRLHESIYCCCSVTKLCQTLQSHGLQQARLPCPSLSPGVCSYSCPLSQWFCLTISSSVTSFSSCPQSFPGSGPFPMSWPFTSVGQSIGALTLASVLPMNIQDCFPVGFTPCCQGLSRVFCSTTVWRHQFFGTQPS